MTIREIILKILCYSHGSFLEGLIRSSVKTGSRTDTGLG